MSACHNFQEVAQNAFSFAISRNADKINESDLADTLLRVIKIPAFKLDNPKNDAKQVWDFIREYHGAGETVMDAGYYIQLQMSGDLEEWGALADRIAYAMSQPYISGSVIDDACIRTTATQHEIADVLEDNPWLIFLLLLEPVLLDFQRMMRRQEEVASAPIE